MATILIRRVPLGTCGKDFHCPHRDAAAVSSLNIAWAAVNALGGVADQNNSYDKGFVDAVSKALGEIEKLGGSDPLA